MAHLNSKKVNNYYRYKHENYADLESKRRKSPIEVRPSVDNSEKYFGTNYSVTLHYVNRYIERVFKEDITVYNRQKKKNLAMMLESILPVGTGLSIEHIEDGVKSIIRAGIAITVYNLKE